MRTLITTLICLLILSCSASKSTSSKQLGKKTLKGTWQVTNIRFVGEEGIYKANLFDTADSPCFKGSQWVFISNNGTGKFTLNETNKCSASTSRILWSFFEPGDGSRDFQFKLVDTKNKPLLGKTTGYRMKIIDLTPTTMETRVKTTYENQPFEVVLEFQKISDDITL